MRSTSTNNSLDAVMAQIVDSLKKFDAAIQTATQALTGNKGNVSATVAALAGVQSAQVQINNIAAFGSPGQQTSTSAAFGGMGGGTGLPLSPSLTGANSGALVQGSDGVPFGGGQSPSFGSASLMGGGSPASTPAALFATQVNIGSSGYRSPYNPNSSQPSVSSRAIVGGVVGHFAASALSSAAGAYASGDYNPLANTALAGGVTGAFLGASAGALVAGPAGPFTGAVGPSIVGGASIGRDLGSALVQAAAAPLERQRQTEQILRGLPGSDVGALAGELRGSVHLRRGKVGMDGHFGFEADTPFSAHRAGTLSDLSEEISNAGKSPYQKLAIKGGVYFGTDIISQQDTARTYKVFNEALREAGDNPDEAYNLTSRTARKYYGGSPAIAEKASSLIANRNRFGRNSLDLLQEFGTNAYTSAMDALGRPDLTSDQSARYGLAQTSGYLADKASYAVRGAGKERGIYLRGQLEELSHLPDFDRSRTKAQLEQEIRQAGRQEFDEKSITKYDIPNARLQGERERQNVLPYSPGDRFATDLKSIALNKSHIRDLQSFMQERKKNGQLSEAEELDLTQQIEAGKTDNYRAIADISSNFESRLPALAAGRPRFAQSFNSWQGAAINLHMMGSANRSFGARNGAQLKVQDDFVRSLGGDEDEIAPRSRTQGINNAHNSDKLADAINRLADMIGKGSGGGTNMRDGQRTGEAAGQQAAQLSQKDVGQNSYHNLRN